MGEREREIVKITDIFEFLWFQVFGFSKFFISIYMLNLKKVAKKIFFIFLQNTRKFLAKLPILITKIAEKYYINTSH
jgi:hypothetical protein